MKTFKTHKDLKTFLDVCKVEGLDIKTIIPDFSCLPKKDRKYAIAVIKRLYITRAANRLANNGKEWIVDYKNPNQRKWEVIFDSSGLRCDDCDWNTNTTIGSRSVFISREVAKDTVDQFEKVFKDCMI